MNLHRYISDLTSGDDQRAEAAAQALAQKDPSQVIPALLNILSMKGATHQDQVHRAWSASDAPSVDPSVDHRWWALRALAEISHPKISSILAQSLSDPDPAVRQCAALGLRTHPDPQAIPPLIAALNDPDSLNASLAADALEAIGAEAVPALLEVLQSGPQAARLKAVRALATIGDTRSIPALYAALDEDSAWMEYWAAEGLERMGVGMVFFKPS
jgi:HEAT repeat protein